MKVALITSGQEGFGVEYLSAVAKEAGHDVRLFFDPQVFGGGIFFRIDYLMKKFDLKDTVVREVLAWGPDIVGFSVMNHNYLWGLDVAGMIKARQPELPVIFGGIHPTSVPDTVIANDCVDMVAIGESERSFVELLGRMELGESPTDIAGIHFKRNGEVIKNPPGTLVQELDTLPFPDKALFYDKVPAFKDYPYVIMASRGCPFNCTFCCNSLLRGLYKGQKYLRRRSVDNVIEELKFAKEKYDIPEVYFIDELFPSDAEWLEEFVEKYTLEIGLPFQAFYHFKMSNERNIALLKKAGCYQVELGLQSASERVRRDICNRRYSNDEVREAMSLLKRYDIDVIMDVIFALPTETEEELEGAISLYQEIRPGLIYVLWLTYFPGTAIIEKGIEEGLVTQDIIDRMIEGRGSYYHAGTAVHNRKTFQRYQLLLDLIPLIPKKTHQWLVEHDWALSLIPKGFIFHFFLNFLASARMGLIKWHLWRIKTVFSKMSVP